jgi:endo-1,4-beta-xylanase
MILELTQNPAAALAVFCLACAVVPSGSADVLHKVFRNDFLVGNVVGNSGKFGSMRKDPREAQVLVREFNCLTAENLMKSEYLQPRPGEFHFEGADEFVKFALRHDMELVGHALVWHAQAPDWFFKDAEGQPVSREVMVERMRNHIHTVVGRYKGRIKYWDVVNEAVDTKWVVDESLPPDEEGNPQKKQVAFYRDSPWHQIIGEDFIELAFRFAHEADPSARLIYNDYGMTGKAKAAFVAEMVRSLRAKGVPVHGIGMQGHWHLEYPEPEALAEAIDLFAATGAKVSITELDIGVLPRAGSQQGADIAQNEELRTELNPYTNGVPQEVLAEQAEKYRTLFEVLKAKRRDIERVTFWGVSDQYSWRNGWPVRGRTAHPLLFDSDFQPKPAYHAVKAAGH